MKILFRVDDFGPTNEAEPNDITTTGYALDFPETLRHWFTFSQRSDLLLAIAGFIVFNSLVDILLSVFDQSVEQAG
jgi:hypothetical protein